MAILVQSNKKPSVSFPSQTGSIITFNSQYAGLPLKSCKVNIPVTQEGTGDPSPDNVRNFIGFSGVNVSRTGKNLLNNPDKTITQEFYVINNVNVPMAAGYYVLSFEFSGTNNRASLRVDNENGTAIFTTTKTITNGHNEFLINLPSNGSFVKLYSTAVGTYSNFQIELGNQFTTYEPYNSNSNTYSISFGQTVYSANLDVLTGILTVTHKLATFDGSENWVKSTTYNGGYYISDWVSANSVNYSRDHYQNIARTVWTSIDYETNDYVCFFESALNFKVDGDLYPTLADFKNFLSQNNLQVWYPLPTPEVINLGGMEIATLQGTNNLFASTGETTVQYIKIGG